jgi:hypothetical protein
VNLILSFQGSSWRGISRTYASQTVSGEWWSDGGVVANPSSGKREGKARR